MREQSQLKSSQSDKCWLHHEAFRREISNISWSRKKAASYCGINYREGKFDNSITVIKCSKIITYSIRRDSIYRSLSVNFFHSINKLFTLPSFYYCRGRSFKIWQYFLYPHNSQRENNWILKLNFVQ